MPYALGTCDTFCVRAGCTAPVQLTHEQATAPVRSLPAHPGCPRGSRAARKRTPRPPCPPLTPRRAAGCKNVTQIIEGHGSLSTLAGLLMRQQTTILQGILNSGNLTFVAPDNKAWAALGADLLDRLYEDTAGFEEVRTCGHCGRSLMLRILYKSATCREPRVSPTDLATDGNLRLLPATGTGVLHARGQGVRQLRRACTRPASSGHHPIDSSMVDRGLVRLPAPAGPAISVPALCAHAKSEPLTSRARGARMQIILVHPACRSCRSCRSRMRIMQTILAYPASRMQIILAHTVSEPIRVKAMGESTATLKDTSFYAAKNADGDMMFYSDGGDAMGYVMRYNMPACGGSLVHVSDHLLMTAESVEYVLS